MKKEKLFEFLYYLLLVGLAVGLLLLLPVLK